MFKPEFPDELTKSIQQYTINKLPAFFEFAKDKSPEQITERNNSFVNKLYSLIPDTKIDLRKLKLGHIDYKLLMNNPDLEIDDWENNEVIKEYLEISRTINLQLNSILNDKLQSPDVMSKSQVRLNVKYGLIIQKTRRVLFGIESDVNKITDMLVKYLYGYKNSKHKTLLWLCYGDVIYQNLSDNLSKQFKEIQCIDCGKWISVSILNYTQRRCYDCQKIYRNQYQKELMKNRYYNKGACFR